MKLLFVTGWVIKFAEKLKSLKNPSYTYKYGVIMLYISILIPWYKPYITTSNVNEAKVLWIRDVQKDILTSFNYQNL